MPDRRKQAADVLVTTVMLAVGFATGNPLLEAIAGGIAVNWAADLTWAGWARARDRLLGALTAEGALAALAPHLAELPPAVFYPLWREALQALARRTRQRG